MERIKLINLNLLMKTCKIFQIPSNFFIIKKQKINYNNKKSIPCYT